MLLLVKLQAFNLYKRYQIAPNIICFQSLSSLGTGISDRHHLYCVLERTLEKKEPKKRLEILLNINGKFLWETAFQHNFLKVIMKG